MIPHFRMARLLTAMIFLISLLVSPQQIHSTREPYSSQYVTHFTDNAPQITLLQTLSTNRTCGINNQISVLAGSEVTYCYRVTNTGTTTFTSHSLNDSNFGVLIASLSLVLPPSATHTITQTKIVTQTINSNALWQANGPEGNATASSSSLVSVQPAQISLLQTVGLSSDGVDCPTQKTITVTLLIPVIHCYTVTNTGAVTLNIHRIGDNVLGTIQDNLSFSLASGVSAYITETIIHTNTITSLATWVAHNGIVTASDSNSVTINVIPAGITLQQTVGIESKCAVRDSIDVGLNASVTFCYVVRNIGSIPLTIHQLKDSEFGQILSDLSYLLLPGASGFITRTTIVNSSIVNIAEWTATNGDITVRASDKVTVTVQPAAIIMSMGVGYNQFDCTAGNNITVPPYTELVFCYGIRNSGTIPLSVHKIIDDQLGVIHENYNQTVLPGDTFVISKSATVVKSADHMGQWYAGNGTITATSSASARVNVTPIDLALIVTASSTPSGECSQTSSIVVPYGAPVTYCYTIRNITGITLTNHNLFDNKFGQIISDLSYTLPPNSSAFITITVPATTTMTNTATWTATDGRALANAVGSSSVRVLEKTIYFPILYP
jgi:hypothetical protein